MEKGLLAGVRWVLFDAVGTLIYAAPPVAEVYFAAARRFGSSLSMAEIEVRFCDALQAEQRADSGKLERPPTSEVQERERWRRIVASVIADAPDEIAPLFEQLWSHFAEFRHWRLFPDVAAVLSELSQRGHRLGIASNFDARLHRVAVGMPELRPIEQIFVSSKIGYSKPDPRYFVAIQERLSVAPAEIMLVGDDEGNDSVGAAAAGWRSVLLVRAGRGQAPGAIVSLAELA